VTDTSPEVEARLQALFRGRTGSDRVRMACDMFDLARALMVANLRSTNPGITDPELRAKIFERTYGADFDDDDRARIVARLRGQP
jgi:hypothetical protein